MITRDDIETINKELRHRAERFDHAAGLSVTSVEQLEQWVTEAGFDYDGLIGWVREVAVPQYMEAALVNGGADTLQSMYFLGLQHAIEALKLMEEE